MAEFKLAAKLDGLLLDRGTNRVIQFAGGRWRNGHAPWKMMF
jgi:hypothetical protein